jgi:hypothetical protein
VIDCYACHDGNCGGGETCAAYVEPIKIPEHNLDIPESKIQEIVLAHVNRIPGVEVWRMNTGGARTATGFVRYGEPGQADLAGLMAPTGRRLEIELKAKRGKLRDTQEEYRERIERCGGLYIVARSLPQAMIPICDFLRLPYVLIPRPVT